MLRYIIVISMLISMNFAFVEKLERCPVGNKPSDVEVRVGNSVCTSNPCPTPMGSEINAYITFPASAASRILTPVVKIYFGAQSIGTYELPEDKRNACNWLIGTDCPVSKGEDVTYLLKMPVPTVEAAVVGVQLTMLNDKENPEFCFRIDLDVK